MPRHIRPTDPRIPRQGRPFNTSTALGKLMAARGLRVKDVERETGISYRTLSDYLASRSIIGPDHMARLTSFLRVRASALRDLGAESAETVIAPPMPDVSLFLDAMERAGMIVRSAPEGPRKGTAPIGQACASRPHLRVSPREGAVRGTAARP